MNNLAAGLKEASVDHDQGPILEAVHLCKLFPLSSLNLSGKKRAVHAVEDASLALKPGHATALVGESGSGKTTVARILAGLYRPTSGTIHFRGEPAKLTDKSYLRTYRRHVQTALEWEVRVQRKSVGVHADGDLPARAVADIFPAYDDDEGGVLVVLTPTNGR